MDNPKIKKSQKGIPFTYFDFGFDKIFSMGSAAMQLVNMKIGIDIDTKRKQSNAAIYQSDMEYNAKVVATNFSNAMTQSRIQVDTLRASLQASSVVNLGSLDQLDSLQNQLTASALIAGGNNRKRNSGS